MIRKSAAAGLLATVAAAPGAGAQQWEYSGSLYLWAAGIDGSTSAGSDFEVGFGDVVDNLDFGVLGSLQARRGKWYVAGDLVFLDASAGTASTRPVLPALPGGGFTIESTAAVAVKGTVLNIIGGYELLRNPNLVLDGIAGVRYLDLDTALNLEVSSGGGANSVNIDRSGDWLDAIAGLRGRSDLDGNWFIPFYADIGTGESDLTWQAFTGIGYDFGRSDIVIGYRHIDWDLGRGGLISDIAFSGAFIRYGFKF